MQNNLQNSKNIRIFAFKISCISMFHADEVSSACVDGDHSVTIRLPPWTFQERS